MSRVLPILFNGDMVKAIIENRKGATRRAIKPPYFVEDNGYKPTIMRTAPKSSLVYKRIGNMPIPDDYMYKTCDYLYVRETWNFVYDVDEGDKIVEGTGRYIYYADDSMPFSEWVDPDTGIHRDAMPWRPSIHMPKAAARIWLRITDVRPQRLQDMTLDDFLKEGIILRPEAFNDPENAYMQAKKAFIQLWDSTIPRRQQDIYGWNANPWVGTIEFERCEKPKEGYQFEEL